MEVGRIVKVPLREIWKNEAYDFTTWLGDNIDTLSEVLGVTLTVNIIEKGVGPFSADIFAEDENGTLVVIENQLEKTDHDHLGKLLTYLTNLEAKTAIWITSAPRDEHKKVIDWLNESTPDDIAFYLIQLEAIKILDSSPAPLFTIVSEPTAARKAIGEKKRELAERHLVRKEFWTQLIEQSSAINKMYAAVSPRYDHWLGVGAGKTGLSYNLVITNDHAQVELYLDRGKDYPELNKQRFEYLFAHKDEIELLFGNRLQWERLDKKRASRVSYRFEGKGLPDKDDWPEIIGNLLVTADKMQKAFAPFIKKLPN